MILSMALNFSSSSVCTISCASSANSSSIGVWLPTPTLSLVMTSSGFPSSSWSPGSSPASGEPTPGLKLAWTSSLYTPPSSPSPSLLRTGLSSDANWAWPMTSCPSSCSGWLPAIPLPLSIGKLESSGYSTAASSLTGSLAKLKLLSFYAAAAFRLLLFTPSLSGGKTKLPFISPAAFASILNNRLVTDALNSKIYLK